MSTGALLIVMATLGTAGDLEMEAIKLSNMMECQAVGEQYRIMQGEAFLQEGKYDFRKDLKKVYYCIPTLGE